MHDKLNVKSTQFERNYRKAYMTLLSAATNGAKAVDTYFFGEAGERDEDSEEIRPYFYGFITFCLAVFIWLLTQN